MNEHDDKDAASVLAPLATAYEPSEADAARVLAKIQASLVAQPAAPAALPPPAAPPPRVKPLVLVGVMCALAIVGAVVVGQGRREVPPARVVAPASVSTAQDPQAAPESVTVAPSSSLTSVPVGSLPSVATAKPVIAAPPGSAATPDNAPSSDTLEREARLLAEARRAVQRGDGTQALAVLDQHAREFPNGFLSSDRGAERIVVLCSLGRRDEAVAAAKIFLAGRPVGPLTQRVTMSCAGQP